MAPKTISSAKTVVDIATDIAVITLNCGFQRLCYMLWATDWMIQLKINTQLYNFVMEVDRRRVTAANRSASKNRKTTRKDLASLRKEAEEQNERVEGQLYGAGIAE